MFKSKRHISHHQKHPFKRRQDFHGHKECQDCPYKRYFQAHFQAGHDELDFHGHHQTGHSRHPSSEQRQGAIQLDDGSIQCLCCSNECIMTVSGNGSVKGNRCPRGAEAAQNIEN